MAPTTISFNRSLVHRLLQWQLPPSHQFRHLHHSSATMSGKQPGILYVTMSPLPSLSSFAFRNWHNNDYGPSYLRLPIIESGLRYQAIDSSTSGKGKPEWLTLYEVSDMSRLISGDYTLSRDNGLESQNAHPMINQIDIDKRYFDIVSERTVKGYTDVAQLQGSGDASTVRDRRVTVAVSISLQDDNPEKKAAFDRWYEEEHIPMLSVVPGWLRTRRFVTNNFQVGEDGAKEYLALHEYTSENGLDGPVFVAATTTPWNYEIKRDVVQEKRRRVYEHVYTLGPAPRDLESSQGDDMSKVNAIESYIKTRDGMNIDYRLDGCTDEEAPLLVLSNSVLVDFHIWDGFIKHFLNDRANHKFRILRYNTRGRTPLVEQVVTLDTLSSDLIDILDALHVSKATAAIGVSLGGITVLNAALKYPERLQAFVCCDTSSKSPERNEETWKERIAVAEKEGALAATSTECVVGEQLAEMTAKRWFVKESWDDPDVSATCREVQNMVASNSLDGFKGCVQALYDYDVTAAMAQGKPKGAFVVGSDDGMLPDVMKQMAGAYAEGDSEFFVIQRTGHLPMVERPEEFAKIVSKILNDS